MITFQKLTDLGVFVATGYICAGTAIAVLGGIPLFTTYFESTFLLVSVFILGVVLVAGILGILIMHYAVRKVGAKQVFEQDILVYIIGMLFMALTLNKAMFLVGLFISSMALPVFFYENFTRQVKVARRGGSKVLACNLLFSLGNFPRLWHVNGKNYFRTLYCVRLLGLG